MSVMYPRGSIVMPAITLIRLHFRWHTHECSVTKRFYCPASNSIIRLYFRWHTHECSVTKSSIVMPAITLIRLHFR